jgi:hypothetical protein
MSLFKISIVVIALLGLGIVFYRFLQRGKEQKKKEKHSGNKEADTIDHIRSLLFLDTPLEVFVMGYFGIIALMYGGMLIAQTAVPGLYLTALYLTGIMFLLLGYKALMEKGILKRVSTWVAVSSLFSLVIFILVIAGLDVPLIPLLQSARQYSLTLHLLGMVFGLGATIVVDVMFIHFLASLQISVRESVILHLLSQMIILGLILLILSGVGLYMTDIEGYNSSGRFLMKMVTVLVATVNGLVLNLYVTPKMDKISLVEEDQGQHETLKKIAFALGGISIVSWFSAYFLAMIKVLSEFSFTTLLLAYLALLVAAVVGSQIAKKVYEGREPA